MPSLETGKPIKKTFDAVELMRQLRSQVHGEIGRLGRAELKEYLRARVNMPRPVAGEDSKAT
uniref:Uncharacterized protein n=1 Tax=Candidatus Kentrum eta TaxID=2126337 RepID=A0A450UM11_9GAMM|nr:MAG: hypothetical protein BECKH772A_GA0070896_100089 [Candidatus Kentron sp. H]VFJ93563.1 MAG: hypothetical protein BECKH772B_GA0070898_1004619 [Candidatus Kentron sp. H]VFJ94883.1 MAG: hypothetical protein BECKH772C_GA0070978_1000139 [Candidatus Kentron sp. H]